MSRLTYTFTYNIYIYQARSQDFFLGGGGGAYLNNWYAMLVPKTHIAHGLLNSNYSARPFTIPETLTSVEGARR